LKETFTHFEFIFGASQLVNGCFLIEFFINGKSTTSPRTNVFLAPTHQHYTQGWTDRQWQFSRLGYEWTRNGPNLPKLVHAQAPLPLGWLEVLIHFGNNHRL